jgi:hypothetical protein
LLLYDLCYYWLHRAGHEVAIFWAAHVVHHQSQEYNLSTALRQTASGGLLGWIFYLPLALLGVPPLLFGIVALVDLLYQFWVHTEHVGKLGWFDRVFCSPSNHRVHHAVNEGYVDRNYGGILVVWDRMFGTFQEEHEPCVYGTRAPLNSWDPLWANLEVYAGLAATAWRTPRWRDKLALWFKPPGWEPAGAWPKPGFDISTVQRWVDKWFWRSFRLLPRVAMLQDYMMPKRAGSWRESWDTYVEAPVEALFAELAPYGLKKPSGWQAACAAKDHLSHQAWNAFYGYGDALAFHTWVPSNEELEWLDRQYPNTFDRWYRPRLAYYAQREAAGQRFHNHSLPMQCQVCQQPMMFTEPGDGRWIAYRETHHHDESFHFCSDQCETIFTNEPEKYVQAQLPSHAILQARKNHPTEDALKASIADLGVVIGRDNGEFNGSEDDIIRPSFDNDSIRIEDEGLHYYHYRSISLFNSRDPVNVISKTHMSDDEEIDHLDYYEAQERLSDKYEK